MMQRYLDKLQKVHQDAMANFAKRDLKFKMDAEMLSFIVINGFFLSILLFLQLFIYFILNYTSDVGWFSFFAAVAYFVVFLKPTEDEKLTVQGYFSNFDGSQQFKPKYIHKPATEKEIITIVKNASAKAHKVKVFGAGSVWNAIGFSKSELIVMDRYKQILQVNKDAKTVKVQAGIRLGELCIALYQQGLTLSNVGWLSQQTVGGAIQTSTHASSGKLGNFSTKVVALELITADGHVHQITKDNKDLFDAVRNGLGVFGVVSTVTLQCEPAFNVQKTTQVVSIDEVSSDVTSRVNSNQYFSFWFVPHVNKANLFIANKTDKQPASESGATPVAKYQSLAIEYGTFIVLTIAYKVLFGVAAVVEFLTPTFLGFFLATIKKSDVIQRSYEGLFENFAEVFPRWSEVEYFVPVENTSAVLKELQSAIKSGGWKINFPTRVSFVQQDTMWLSEAFGRDSACFSIGMYKKANQWRQFVKKIDTIMKKYEGRPHWAKYHQLTKQDVEQLYPRWNDFQEVRKRLDPNGVFLNDYLASYFS